MAHTNESPIDMDWYPLSDEDIRHFDDTGYLIGGMCWTRIPSTN